MIPIHIDLSEIANEFSLTVQQSQELGGNIIDRIIGEYSHKWEDLVNRNLRGTRKLYKQAMYIDRISDTEVVFGLQPGEDGLALAIEEGKGAYDEKPFFKKSDKRKTTLGGGWYVTVPFRYASPEALAESQTFQDVLPKEIYDIAKNNSGKRVSFSQLPQQYAQLGKRKEIQTSTGVIPEYIHKSPKFQGLVRLDISSTENENRGGYFTFRRVSNNSDPLSWIHPGFEAKKFMDKALNESQITEVADMVIDEFLNQI